jgi:transcriptional regulator with XRE-family HTH domain
MLPKRTDKNFPSALKLARESKGLTYTQLAKLLDISPVMPSRRKTIIFWKCLPTC